MKRSISILIVFLVAVILSGCILSKTPNANDVTMNLGEEKTFSVNIFPSNSTYTWTMDGNPISNTLKSYEYTASACGDHTLKVIAKHICGTDTQTWTIHVNCPPVANAGPDQSVTIYKTVTLDGYGSTDPDNNIASYQWQQTGGPAVTLTNANKVTATFRANVALGSELTFELKVTDGGGLWSTDTCVITIIDPISDLLNSLVSIPAGNFQMGSTDNQYGMAQITTPVHEVTLQAFKMGAYEVTQAQYYAAMGINNSYFQESNGYPGTENNPVESIGWNDAKAFCTQLSALTGRTFDLPSEAQWEYACRAGTTTLYSFGDDDADLGDYSWYWTNSNGTGGSYGTHPVGTKLPNAWGLYDMHGNVFEMCLDSGFPPYNYVGAPTDGSAWESETSPDRVYRGGGWDSRNFPWGLRSASRFWVTWASCWIDQGFRVVEILP
jgi:formylglycine-generating enzyme required for sulfatase activity